MVGMAREDRGGAIQLLGEEHAHEAVRPGHTPERQDQLGALEQSGIEAVGAADQKRKLAAAVLLPGADLGRERTAG